MVQLFNVTQELSEEKVEKKIMKCRMVSVLVVGWGGVNKMQGWIEWLVGWLVDRMGGKDAWWLWRKLDEWIIIYEMVWNGLKKRVGRGKEKRI